MTSVFSGDAGVGSVGIARVLCHKPRRLFDTSRGERRRRVSSLHAARLRDFKQRFPAIPFIIIDMVVASVLMSMGMMMLSPMIISMPFKLMLFVLVDGWTLLMGSLASSFIFK